MEPEYIYILGLERKKIKRGVTVLDLSLVYTIDNGHLLVTSSQSVVLLTGVEGLGLHIITSTNVQMGYIISHVFLPPVSYNHV